MSNALLFARPGVDMTIDCIPMMAIKSIKSMDSKDLHNEVSDQDFANMVVITLREPEAQLNERLMVTLTLQNVLAYDRRRSLSRVVFAYYRMCSLSGA